MVRGWAPRSSQRRDSQSAVFEEKCFGEEAGMSLLFVGFRCLTCKMRLLCLGQETVLWGTQQRRPRFDSTPTATEHSLLFVPIVEIHCFVCSGHIRTRFQQLCIDGGWASSLWQNASRDPLDQKQAYFAFCHCHHGQDTCQSGLQHVCVCLKLKE